MRRSLNLRVRRAAVVLTLCSATLPAWSPPLHGKPVSVGDRPHYLPGPATLGRVNVITGKHPSVMLVRIPRRTSIDMHLMPGRRSGPNASIEIQGAGRAVGFALTRDAPSDSLPKGFQLAVRLGDCTTPGCDPGRKLNNFMYPFEFGEGVHPRTLRPGVYRLYLIADGSRVRVRFTLEGLRGRTKLHSARRAPVDVRSPKIHTNQHDGRVVYSAGSTYRGGYRGFYVSTIHALGRRFDGALWGLCSYRDLAPPEDVGYGPHCSGAQADGGDAFGYFTGGPLHRGFRVTIIGTYSKNDPLRTLDGRRGVGAWLISPGPIDRVGSQAFFLSYDL
ncbi:MAG TPA: hypothetical protein VNC78_10760 [Actinomycetota bacterium]|nr:hypothetical protein [Actinomycetota bacterium]